MTSTATPQRMLLSVSTSIGTRLSTRSWNSSPSVPTPPNGITTIMMMPAISIAWLRCSATIVISETIITGPSTSSRSSITEPIHSCASSGLRAASRSATPSMPKLAK